jgi:hypothetical protein
MIRDESMDRVAIPELVEKARTNALRAIVLKKLRTALEWIELPVR